MKLLGDLAWDSFVNLDVMLGMFIRRHDPNHLLAAASHDDTIVPRSVEKNKKNKGTNNYLKKNGMAPDESTHTHTNVIMPPQTPPKKKKKNKTPPPTHPPPPQNTKVTDTIQAARTTTDPEAPRKKSLIFCVEEKDKNSKKHRKK